MLVYSGCGNKAKIDTQIDTRLSPPPGGAVEKFTDSHKMAVKSRPDLHSGRPTHTTHGLAVWDFKGTKSTRL